MPSDVDGSRSAMLSMETNCPSTSQSYWMRSFVTSPGNTAQEAVSAHLTNLKQIVSDMGPIRSRALEPVVSLIPSIANVGRPLLLAIMWCANEMDSGGTLRGGQGRPLRNHNTMVPNNLKRSAPP